MTVTVPGPWLPINLHRTETPTEGSCQITRVAGLDVEKFMFMEFVGMRARQSRLRLSSDDLDKDEC